MHFLPQHCNYYLLANKNILTRDMITIAHLLTFFNGVLLSWCGLNKRKSKKKGRKIITVTKGFPPPCCSSCTFNLNLVRCSISYRCTFIRYSCVITCCDYWRFECDMQFMWMQWLFLCLYTKNRVFSEDKKKIKRKKNGKCDEWSSWSSNALFRWLTFFIARTLQRECNTHFFDFTIDQMVRDSD